MKVGLFLPASDRAADPAVIAKRAEQLGFASFWVPEHPIIPVHTATPFPGAADGRIPEAYYRMVDPFVALARASAVTTTIKLGTGICLIPERNPLLLAKEVATLDHYSGGRFIFGIGAGWLKEETEIMGGDFAHRWTQTREAILAMKELWGKNEAEHHGHYYNFPLVYSFPKPLQKPHPPIFMGGSSKHVFKRIVEWGNGWMPVRATAEQIKQGRATLNGMAEQAGRDPSSIEVLAFGAPGRFRERAEIDDLARAGVDQVTVWLTKAESPEALAELEGLARHLLG